MKAATRMSGSPEIAATGSDPSWKGLYRIGSVSATLFVVLTIMALVVDLTAPPPVSGGAATLRFIAENRTIYILEQALWLVPGVFAMIVFLALYVALKDLNKSYAAEAIVAQNNTPTVAGILVTVGILIVSLVMLKGVFPRGGAYLGVATGALGVASEALSFVLPAGPDEGASP